MAVCKISVVTVSLMVLASVSAEFNPNVTVTECSASSVIIHTEHATDEGIIYIQGKGPQCKQFTSSQSRDYYFNFDLCDIGLGVMFRVIVQERPDVQTGSDKVIPVMCIVDMGEIVVGNVILPLNENDLNVEGINKTTKPTASMRIISKSASDVSGESVQISDELHMVVTLDEEYRHDFDIKAKDCWADTLDIVYDKCSPDENLFPNFNRETDGSLVSKFNAFIPTNYEGDQTADVSYKCSLEVCRGSCVPTVCKEIVGWGKKRKRSTSERGVQKITVGTHVRIIARHAETLQHTEDKHKDENLNINKYLFFALAGVGCLSLVTSWVLSCYLYQRLLVARGDAHNVNVARAVGRRLSSMLNLPSGYQLKNEKKTMQFIPIEQGTPQRRRSVTVSISTQTEKSPLNDEVESSRYSYVTDTSCNKVSTGLLSNPLSTDYNLICDSNNDHERPDDKENETTVTDLEDLYSEKEDEPRFQNSSSAKDTDNPAVLTIEFGDGLEGESDIDSLGVV